MDDSRVRGEREYIISITRREKDRRTWPKRHVFAYRRSFPAGRAHKITATHEKEKKERTIGIVL